MAVSPGDALEDRISLSPILIQYWQAAVRWRILIGGIVLGAIIVAFIVTLLTAPRFTARSQIEISREHKNVTNVEGLESQQEGRDLEFYATQYALLKATSLAERVAARLNLAKNDDFFEAHGVEPDVAPGAAAAERTRKRAAVKLLLSHIDITPIRTSRLVDIN